MRLRSVLAAVLGVFMMSESAFALSCMRPDLVKTLEDAKASPKLYHIFVGRFDAPQVKFNPNQFEYQTQIFPPRDPSRTVRGTFTGYSLSNNPRTDMRLTGYPVQVKVTCAASWCGQVPGRGQKIIAFVEAPPGQAPVFQMGACPYWTFPAEPKQVQKVRQCLDRTCQPEAPNW